MKEKSKVKFYFIFYIILVLVVLACIVATAITGLNQAVNNSSEISYINENTNHINSARITFEKTIKLCRDLILYEGDVHRASRIKDDLFSSMNKIDSHIETYSLNIVNAFEFNIVKNIRELLIQYSDCLIMITESNIDGAQEMMEILESQIIPIASEIDAEFQSVIELNQQLSYEYAFRSKALGTTIIVLLITVSSIAFIVILIASIFIVYTISRKDEPNGIMTKS